MRSAVRAGLFVLFLAVVGGAGCAAPMDNAGDAYKRGDYATVVRLVRPLAEQGDAAAQFNLDVLYGKMTPAQIIKAQKLAREWKPMTTNAK